MFISAPSRPLRASSSGVPPALANEKRVRSLGRPGRAGAPLPDAREPERLSLVASLLHLDVLVRQRLLVQDRLTALTGELPRRHIRKLVVVPQRLAVLGLRLRPEVATAGLAADQGVDAHQLAELEEVGHPAGPLQRLVELRTGAQHPDVGPELVLELADPADRLAQTLLRPLHPAVVPHDLAELPVE